MSEESLTKSKRLLVIAIIVAVQAIFLGLMGLEYHVLDSTVATNFSKSQKTIAESNALLKNDTYSLLANERPVEDPLNAVVYLPEFRIKLPAYSLTKSIAYSLRDELLETDSNSASGPEADVTSMQYIPPDKMTVMDCSNLVRLKVEDKQHPYNPHEKATSVKLADGRTLQVYEFVNSKECQPSWSESVSPGQMASVFKEAQSY